MTAAQRSFADELRPLIAAAGGTAASARVCGVTPQTVNGWLRGTSAANAATQAGALWLLRQATAAAHPALISPAIATP